MTRTEVPNVEIKLRSGTTLALTAIVQTDLGDDYETVFQDGLDSSGAGWHRRKNKFYGWSKWLKKGVPACEPLDSMSPAAIDNL